MKLKKEITFIYMDTSEKSIYMPLYEEARKRGYDVKMTANKFEKCEIGFYCQHVNFPQYSKFSIIMLHDIIQQYGNWPDIWFREPWDKYDIGILPSKQWVTNWNLCSKWYYSRPRLGMYQIGWPKADTINQIKEASYKNEFFKKYNLDLNKKTILYAPAWENDGKQNDFVEAMLPLNVNILIKQYDAKPELFPEMVKNINEMYELHKDIPSVTILPAVTNIFEALAVSDVLVSEESSTMAEAVMMGIPAVSVSDWLIPDVSPSRFPECNYNFVITTNKNDLGDCISTILDNYQVYKNNTIKEKEKNFSNIGKSSCMIMDIIDDYVNDVNVRYGKLKPKEKERLNINKYFKHKYIRVINEIYHNYRIKYKLIDIIWCVLRNIKNAIH